MDIGLLAELFECRPTRFHNLIQQLGKVRVLPVFLTHRAADNPAEPRHANQLMKRFRLHMGRGKGADTGHAVIGACGNRQRGVHIHLLQLLIDIFLGCLCEHRCRVVDSVDASEATLRQRHRHQTGPAPGIEHPGALGFEVVAQPEQRAFGAAVSPGVIHILVIASGPILIEIHELVGGLGIEHLLVDGCLLAQLPPLRFCTPTVHD